MDTSKVGRQKYWSELSVEEKVERTREEVKRLTIRLQSSQEKIDKLVTHRHDGKEILVPYFDSYGGSEKACIQRGPGEDDVYF